MPNNPLQIDAQRDITELKKMMAYYLRTTYTEPLEEVLQHTVMRFGNTPTPEVELFIALLPYVPYEKRHLCEALIKILKYNQVIKEVTPLLVSDVHEVDQVQMWLIKFLLFEVLQKQEKGISQK